MLPFRPDSPADLAAARALFAEAGFTTAGVCGRLGLQKINAVRTIGEGRTIGIDVSDALDVLTRLFIDGVAVPAEPVEALLPAPGREALLRIGLIARHPRAPDHYAASVRLYPTEGLYIVSDLESVGPGLADPENLEPPDHVFSAITSLTGTFLSQVPRTPCDRFLELCAGTGIAALMASRFARHAWALDITERSTRFAEFNARLNGIENVTALRGDLYDPVAGLTFDRIVAHPPYVPASETKMVYRDGGEDGEQIVRRILAELPAYLAEGGRFYLTCVATDRKDAPLERRIRDMVGDRETEFDVVVISHYALPPAEYYGRLAASGRISFDTAEQRIHLFRELQAERIVYSSMVLQRHAHPGARAAFTARRERTEAAEWPETEWLVDWLTRLAEGDVLPAILESRPRLLPHARLQVTHRVEEGEWKVESSKVTVEYPFIRTVEMSVNAATLLTLCDGEHSVHEILDRLKSAGALSPEVPPESFAEFIRELVTEGVLGVGGEPSHRAEGAAVGEVREETAPLEAG
jgi:SAM-dependent methyltransferase